MILAQSTVGSEWAAPLMNLGVAGYMIWFLTTKGQEALKNLATALREGLREVGNEIAKFRGALDRWSKTQLIAMLLHPNFPPEARQPAKTMLEDIEQADQK